MIGELSSNSASSPVSAAWPNTLTNPPLLCQNFFDLRESCEVSIVKVGPGGDATDSERWRRRNGQLSIAVDVCHEERLAIDLNSRSQTAECTLSSVVNFVPTPVIVVLLAVVDTVPVRVRENSVKVFLSGTSVRAEEPDSCNRSS